MAHDASGNAPFTRSKHASPSLGASVMSPLSTETATEPRARAVDVALAPIVSLRTGQTWAKEPAPLHAHAMEDALAAFHGESGLALRVLPAPSEDVTRALVSLASAVDARGLPRGRIAIEWCYRDVSLEDARAVSHACRALGFLVVSAEVAVGYPHVDRVAAVAPDVIKLDAHLAASVAEDRGRLEACRAVMELARSIGALVIANEVQSVADVLELALLGIDLFEGPVVADPSDTIALRTRLRRRAEEEVVRRRDERAVHDRVFVTVMSRIAQARAHELDMVAEQIVRDVSGLEALYVLDQRGVQLTKTWFHPSIVARGGFAPAERGADLGLKEYFLEVGHGAGYVSRPYVSMASGRVSVTHSRRLRLCDSTNVVVCCDVPSADPAAQASR